MYRSEQQESVFVQLRNSVVEPELRKGEQKGWKEIVYHETRQKFRTRTTKTSLFINTFVKFIRSFDASPV